MNRLSVFFQFTVILSLCLVCLPSAHAGWWGRVTTEALPLLRAYSRAAVGRYPVSGRVLFEPRFLRAVRSVEGRSVLSGRLHQEFSPYSLVGSLPRYEQSSGGASSFGLGSSLSSAAVVSWVTGSLVLAQTLDQRQARDRVASSVQGSLPGGLSQEEVNAKLHELFASDHILPEALVAHVSVLCPELASLLSADAHVNEGYSIGEHTALALKWFEGQKKFYRLSEMEGRYPELGDLNELLRVALLLHDIGKSLGPADEQLLHTLPIAEKYLKLWGYNDQQVRVVLMWIQGPSYGEFIKEEVSLGEVLEKVISQAKESQIQFSDWLELSFLFYLGDAVSYPFVRENFFTTDSQGKLLPDSSGLRELLLRGHAISRSQGVIQMNHAADLERLMVKVVPVMSVQENQSQLKEYRQQVTDEDRCQALDQLHYDFYSFFSFIPLGSAQERSELERFLTQVQDDFDHLIWMIKHKNHEERPFRDGAQVDPELRSFSLEAFDHSFPSGHAAQAQLHGLILSRLYPEYADAILRHAQSIGRGRILLGLHYPSDVEAGQVLALEVYQLIQSNPEFLSLLEKFGQKSPE